jgi:5-formyltetrahydrofolate cyclo-ligase
MAGLTSSKNALRQEIKDILKNINLEEKQKQSINIFKKVSLKMTHKSINIFQAFEEVMLCF